MKFHYDKDSTPINGDEICNLIPHHIQTQAELNLWEQNNIYAAEQKLFRGRKPVELSVEFVQKVHRLMFNETWKWAGQFRLQLYTYYNHYSCYYSIYLHYHFLEFACSHAAFTCKRIAHLGGEVDMKIHSLDYNLEESQPSK